MIKITGLKKRYQDTEAVNIPSLEILLGESVGLVGNNGAGKTTFFRMVLDLVLPNDGEIRINDVLINGNENWKKSVSAYIDESFLINYLTPEEYFYFIGQLQNKSKKIIDELLTQFTDFFNGEILHAGKYIRDLSKGNQSKVGIVACLLQDPTLLLLDEPFANIDPTSQFMLIEILRKFNQKFNKILLVSSHDLSHISEISSRVLVMKKGFIIKDELTSQNTLTNLKDYFNVK